jgi:hypothetical protein
MIINKIKKIIVILFVNIIVFLILFNLFSYFIKKNVDFSLKTYSSDAVENSIDLKNYNIEPPDYINTKKHSDIEFQNYCNETRIIFNADKYTKNPILILGCSYAFGHGLKQENTFANILSKNTQRPVYNFSTCSGNGYESIYNIDDFINQSEMNKNIIKNSDYIIYLYMHDHINRYLRKTYTTSRYDNLYNSSGIIQFLNKFFLIRYTLSNIKLYKIIKEYPNSEEAEKYLKLLIKDINKELKILAPKAKLIIIIYDEKIPMYFKKSEIKFVSDIMNSDIWNEIENETDIKVVHSKDIMGFVFDKNYKLKIDDGNWHPNERVWKEFTPLFANKYIK